MIDGKRQRGGEWLECRLDEMGLTLQEITPQAVPVESVPPASKRRYGITLPLEREAPRLPMAL